MYAVATPPADGTERAPSMGATPPPPQQQQHQGQVPPAYYNTSRSPLEIMTMSPANANAATPAIRNNSSNRPYALRSPSPTIQKRLENAAPNTFRGAYYPKTHPLNTPNNNNTITPNNNNNNNRGSQQEKVVEDKPSSTGLIRLTLNKPMGIVFEPMTDPHNSSQQRGVRICDLPRTGAAALSRKLEVGDELLSINNMTVSRMTFDEIMDIIIDADPLSVNLLFRRPRKEQLDGGTNNIPTGAASIDVSNQRNNADQRTGVKWSDGKDGTLEEKKKVRISSKKAVRDDETEDSSSRHTLEKMDRRDRRRRTRKPTHNRFESESFLDMLIDSLCAPIIGQNDNRKDDYSDDDEGTLYSMDDSTYVTYEDEEPKKKDKRSTSSTKERGRGKTRNDNYTNDDEDDGTMDVEDNSYSKSRNRGLSLQDSSDKDLTNQASSLSKSSSHDMESSNRLRIQPSTSDVIYEEPEEPLDVSGNYEDDATLETVETLERAKALAQLSLKQDNLSSPPPLGLMPNASPQRSPQKETEDNSTLVDTNIPISTLEYDQFDAGADVSVMESVGGPSLLLEARRHSAAVHAGAAAAKDSPLPVDAAIMAQYGLDYPTDLGSTREETIQQDPLRFYQYVVRGLLQQHEPEKVRLLDKLLTKYKGREPHLIQKLSARYDRQKEESEDNELSPIPQPPSTQPQHNNNNNNNNNNNTNNNTNDDGFQNFGAFPRVNSKDVNVNNAFEAWPPMEDSNDPTKSPSSLPNDSSPRNFDKEEEASQSSQSQSSHSDFSSDSIDGTSPAVIAQVSELLNYVYGKTSVPGQIDRVSTIMRAYEGREAILLELLETKALLKANEDKESASNLPAALRNKPTPNSVVAPISPVSGITANTDEKEMALSPNSGVTRPTATTPKSITSPSNNSTLSKNDKSNISFPKNFDESVDRPKENQMHYSQTKPSKSSPNNTSSKSNKKKKGLFGGIFKKNKKSEGAFPVSNNGKSKKKMLSPKVSTKKGVLLHTQSHDDASI